MINYKNYPPKMENDLKSQGYSVNIVGSRNAEISIIPGSPNKISVAFNFTMMLEKDEIKTEKTYYCPHTPEDNCECRKPKAKFLKDAEKDFGINLKKSFVVGDRKSDFELGRNAGCKTIHVLTGNGMNAKNDVKPDYIAKDLYNAVINILS